MELLCNTFGDAFVSVLAIIGIILVGGFLIFFLGDLVLSVLDPQYVHFWQRKKNGEKVSESVKEEVKEIAEPQEETKVLEFKFDEADKDAFAKEDEEISNENLFEEETVEEPVEETDELKAEEELFKQNMLKEIEERRQKQLEEEKEEKYENFFFDDEDINVFNEEKVEESTESQEVVEESAQEVTEESAQEVVEETAEEVAEETAEVETIEESEEEPIVEVEEVEEVTEENNEQEPEITIEELKAKFEAEIASLQARNQELENELGNKEDLTVLPAGSLEEYEARLEILKERLAANEKELRKVKKEYIPLRKVNRTLESDQRKLRRKEAIVAKQKVVLYGVNNIADIDEEKAKKLSEELDLLEGLKLSVQHCEEVMNANKDRYPILENTFNILVSNNETLKSDIKETEEAIEALKTNDTTDAE